VSGHVRSIRTSLFALLLIGLLAGSRAAARGQAPTFYEKLAFGRIVVAGTCLEQGRRALVQVDEVFKGQLPSQRISIAYRGQNWDRSPGQPKIEFHLGERSILMLEAESTEHGSTPEEARFVLAGGCDGKVDLPAEGSEALLEAARRIVQIQSQSDQNEIWEGQRHLLQEKNPLLVEAGFQEVLKFRLGNPAMVPLLTRYLADPHDSFRLASLRVFAQILERSRQRGDELPGAERLRLDILSVARGDTSAEVRAQAVRTLKVSGRPDLREVMAQMAGSDPSQIVRYEAQLALMEINRSTARSGDDTSVSSGQKP